MSSEIDTFEQKAATLAKALAAVAEIVSRAAGTSSGVTSKALAAADAITVIGAVIDTVRALFDPGHLHRTSPEEISRELDKLVSHLRDNDAAAQAALDQKFGKK